jgi:hypothetical protein
MDQTPQDPTPQGEAADQPAPLPVPPPVPAPPAVPMAPPTWSDPNWGFPPAQSAPETAPPGRSGPKLALIVALVVLLVGGATGVYLVTKGGSKTPQSELTTPSGPGTQSPSASVSLTPPPLLAPISVTSSMDGLAVTLSWSEPTGGAAVDRFTVYRNTNYLGSVVAPTTTYTDEDAIPGKTYTYEVKAVVGTTESESATLVVSTPIPALSAAHLQGDFNVKPKLISKFGFTSYSADFTLGWHFKAKCSSGPCNVTWTDLGFKDFKATLKRAKANYTGSDSGKFNVTCGSTTITTVLTIDMHVIKAKAINGEWRATKLSGTLTSDQAAQLGCVTSQAVLSITVTLLS